MEILHSIANHVMQIKKENIISLFKLVNAFAMMDFMMILRMNTVELAIILGRN